jgi:hypothetical protein
MGKAGRQATNYIEQKIPQFAHPVLYVVPKNKQDPHIGDQMPPTPVQKHIGEKGPENGDPELLNAFHIPDSDAIGDQTKMVNHGFRLNMIEHENFN